METYSVNFGPGTYFLVHAYSFRSRYSVLCGCDFIEFLDHQDHMVVSVQRSQIESIQILDYSGERPEYKYLKF